MLSKLEADYQETIRCLQSEKTSLEEQVRLLEQSQGYLKNQLAKAISDTERQVNCFFVDTGFSTTKCQMYFVNFSPVKRNKNNEIK